MKAYKNAIKLTERPDIGDILNEGRRSSVGRLRRGEVAYYSHFNDVPKVRHNDRGYCNPHSKATTRRYLKHVFRSVDLRFEFAAEGIRNLQEIF